MSALPLFFEDQKFVVGTEFELSPETSKHALTVLRKQPGDQLALTDGKGSEAVVRISSAGKKSCIVRTESHRQHDRPALQFGLGIAFTKNAARNEWLLEKAAESGVSRIWPLLCDRSVREKFRVDRAQNILTSAMLQSGQFFLPELAEPCAPEALTDVDFAIKLLAHCDPGFPKLAISEALPKGQNALFLIGPEGDFSPREIAALTEKQFISVSLGKNRLRTETAAMAVCSYFNLLNA